MDEEKINPAAPEAEEEDEGEYNEVDLMTLTDEDGEDHEFEVADRLELDGARYVALIPQPATADELLAEDGDLVIMKYCSEDDDEYLSLIDDDDEYYRISGMFQDRLSDLYDFEDPEID